jgi:mannose/cellobiose epimerase-like protein (N-acyl-D-glucosamine 2-epimerase family)
MTKEGKIARKIKRFLRKLGYPRWLHQFGPKTYQLFDHIFALVAAAVFQLSLRRVEKRLSTEPDIAFRQ